MPSRASLAKLEQRLQARALAFPETEETFPWGERAIKIRGKTFLFMRLSTKAITDQCLQWVDESFRAVAPKRVVATLGASPSGPSVTRRARSRSS